MPLQNLQKTKTWLTIALAGLALAGLLSFFLVLGRAPGISSIVDPLFAKRCLVIHVNLALGIWFYAFLAALFYLVPEQSKFQIADKTKAPVLAIVGIVIFSAAIIFPKTTPILSNYVPVLDHPVFFIGLAIFALAMILTFVDKRMLSSCGQLAEKETVLPAAALAPLKAAVFSFMIAVLIFIISWQMTPNHLYSLSFYEVVFWGGGHILQFANMAGMATAWLILLYSILHTPPLKSKWTTLLFRIYLIPVVLAPLLVIKGTRSPLYHYGFTRLMEFGIFPVFVILFILCLKALYQARSNVWSSKNRMAFSGFITSAIMMISGFILGAMISTSNTAIPAHYHASIGAVTVAYMSTTYILLENFGIAIREKWKSWTVWQPIVYGSGQIIFAVGFGYAGLGRKIYGAEQKIVTFSQHLGLVFMGIGGIMAIGAGVIFVAIIWFSRGYSEDQKV